MVCRWSKAILFYSVFFLMILSHRYLVAEYLFDASGTWEVETLDAFDSCFIDDEKIVFDIIIIQSEDEFICKYSGNEGAGTIIGPNYTVDFEYEEDGGIKKRKLEFSLSEKDIGQGSSSWSWKDSESDPDGLGFCWGFRNYTLTKKNESTVAEKEDQKDEFCFMSTLLMSDN